jgi:hypothetical protein
MDRPRWRAGEILRVLCSAELQRQILTIGLSEGPERDIKAVEHSLAGLLHFRPATMQALPLERKVAYVRQMIAASDLQEPLRKLLAWFLLERRTAMLSAFLDKWGIPHQQGHIEGEAHAPSPERAIEAASALQSQFSREDMAVYFATAGLVMGPPWQEALWPLINQLVDGEVPQQAAEGLAAGDEEERPLEETPQFTTLDNLVIKTVVAALSDVEGAITLDQARDLVEEVIHLSPDRHRSYFHRGFLDTLTAAKAEPPFLEGNASRRGWLLAGRLMALARKGDRDGMRLLFRERRQEFSEVMNTPAAAPAAVMIAGPLFEALWDAQAYADAAQAVAEPIAARAGSHFLHRLLHAARDLLLSHRTPEAALVLDLLDGALRHRRHLDEEEEQPEAFVYEIQRRRAQLLRAGGHFAEAEREFERIGQEFGDQRSAEMLADISLCRGSFKWLSDVEVPKDERARADTVARLKAAAEKADEALAGQQGFKTNAQYILGVQALAGGDREQARALLEESYAGMARRSELYPDTLSRCRLYYALAILCSMHEPQFTIAREILQQLSDEATIAEWPLWLLREALGVLHLSPAEGIPLAEWVARRFPQLTDEFLHNVDLVGRSDVLLAALRARTADPQRPIEERWMDYSVLLSCAQGRGDVLDARSILDSLEDLTFVSPSLRQRFSDSLAAATYYEPAWTWEDAQFSRAQLLEAEGRYGDAAVLMASLIHQYLSRDAIDEAKGLYERLKSYGRAAPPYPDVEARIEAIDSAESLSVVPAEALVRSEPIRILFIGGNETQARYSAWILEELHSNYPRLSVTFLPTGWSSGWGAYVDRIRQVMPDHDAAIIMRFVRTEFGRAAREEIGRLGKRWFPCTGHGRDSILRAIVDAARVVAADRLSRK